MKVRAQHQVHFPLKASQKMQAATHVLGQRILESAILDVVYENVFARALINGPSLDAAKERERRTEESAVSGGI